MKQSWLKEISRDLVAFGSVIFYFLVVIRAIIGKNNVFVYQMLIAAITILILHFIIKDASLHVARSLVALVFVSIFYNEMIFTFFAFLVWLLLLVSAYHIKRNVVYIIKGVIIGLLSTIVGYYLASFL